MIDEDSRAKNGHKLKKEMDDKRFTSLFETNSFFGILEIINWLGEQLRKQITSEETSIKTAFSPEHFSQSTLQLFNKGDIFFDSLFKEKGFIPEKFENLRIKTPLSYTVNRLYNKIWRIQENTGSKELKIYFEFRTFIERLLAKHIAADSSFSCLFDWERIYPVTDGLHDFYQTWINNIPVSYIEKAVDELTKVSSNPKLIELANLRALSRDAEKFATEYDAKLIVFGQKSNWEYVRELTQSSDLISLVENLILKDHLLLRLDLKYWIIWIDSLKFPILQDHCFFSIKKIDSYEKIISFIIDSQQSFKTKPEHLLLIALKGYYKFIQRISANLFNLKSGNWNYDQNEDAHLITETARTEYDSWMATGIRATFDNVLNIIFPSVSTFQSNHFVGFFDWINSYSKENIISSPNNEPHLKTLEIISELFQKRLNGDLTNKYKILDLAAPEINNWQFFEKFLGLYENDESDEQFRVKLFNKYLDYLSSDYFSWNVSLDYNEVVINEGCNLAYLISHFSGPLQEWTALFAKFKYWHEGWNVVQPNDFLRIRKELYVIFCGACIAFCFYKEHKNEMARTVFDKVLETTLSQYRFTDGTSKNYLLPLRFLSYMVGKFDSNRFEDFAIKMIQNIDDFESWLVIIGEIISTARNEGINLGDPIRRQLKKHIVYFWQIEMRYSENALKNYLDYYTNLHRLILNYLNDRS